MWRLARPMTIIQMAERILKYELPVDDEPHAVGWYPIHVACQGDEYDVVRVWSSVDDDESRTVQVQVFATGQPIPLGAAYIGTAITHDSGFVWHVYDVTEVGTYGDR